MVISAVNSAFQCGVGLVLTAPSVNRPDTTVSAVMALLPCSTQNHKTPDKTKCTFKAVTDLSHVCPA